MMTTDPCRSSPPFTAASALLTGAAVPPGETMIPAFVRETIERHIADLEAQIAPTVAQIRDLRAYLDSQPAQQRLPTAPKPTAAPRTTRAPASKVGGDDRPQRLREGTQTIEHYFPRGSYSAISYRLGFGSHDATGVWLTLDEWTRAKGENYRKKKVR